MAAVDVDEAPAPSSPASRITRRDPEIGSEPAASAGAGAGQLDRFLVAPGDQRCHAERVVRMRRRRRRRRPRPRRWRRSAYRQCRRAGTRCSQDERAEGQERRSGSGRRGRRGAGPRAGGYQRRPSSGDMVAQNPPRRLAGGGDRRTSDSSSASAVEHGVEVRPLGEQPGDDRTLVGAADAGAPLGGEREEVRHVATSRYSSLSPDAASFVSANWRSVSRSRYRERRAGSNVSTIDLSTSRSSRSTTSSSSTTPPAQIPSAASRSKPPRNTARRLKQRLLFGGEQVVGPLDRGEERLVALARRPAAPGEEAEPLAEPAQDVGREHRAGCGRQPAPPRAGCRRAGRRWRRRRRRTRPSRRRHAR